jgi:glycerol kinase
VVSTDGAVLGAAETAVHPTATADGGVEQDPEELWDSVVRAGRDALARANVARITAVALANQGETVLAWERDSGRPLSRAISWQDRRASVICDGVAAHGDELASLTGLPLDPYFAAAKIAWLRQHVTRDGVATTTDTWLLHRLGAPYVTDAATASRTQLLDLGRVAWSPAACAIFGIDARELPRIVGCAEIVGTTRVFAGEAPVAGLAVDQQAALLAEGCLDAGDAKCTYGTGAFLLLTVGDRPRRSRAGLAASVAWRIGERTTYCLDGQVYTAGAALTWMSRLGIGADAAELDALAASVESAHDVVFVPALAGLAAPFWKPGARGAFVGLTLATERTHVARAVLEGIAAQVALLARVAADDLGRPLARLRADGGLTRSAVLMQSQADLVQAPVEVYPSPDATALGVAALARLALGHARDATAAVGAWQPRATFVPRIDAAEAERRLARWRAAADATSPL